MAAAAGAAALRRWESLGLPKNAAGPADETHAAWPLGCSCCSQKGCAGGAFPFALSGSGRGGAGGAAWLGDAGLSAELSAALARAGDQLAAHAALLVPPSGGPMLKASLRGQFQERYAEKVGTDLFGMAPDEARASFELCTRLLGITWEDDTAADAAAPVAAGAAAVAWPSSLDESYELVKRTYMDEQSRLSDAASHELRLALEALGARGLARVLRRLRVVAPVEPAPEEDALAALVGAVVTASPGPSTLLPHLPRGARRVFRAGLHALSTEHCLTKRRLVERTQRLRRRFQDEQAASKLAHGAELSESSDSDGDSHDEDEESDEALTDEDDAAAEDAYHAALFGAAANAGGALPGSAAAADGGVPRFECALCGMGGLPRGCGCCGLAFCRVCWQLEASLPPSWLYGCVNAECAAATCVGCRRERPCGHCGASLDAAERGVLRRRRKTLSAALVRLRASGVATARATTAAAAAPPPPAAAAKRAPPAQDAEAAAHAAAEQLLREEEAERTAAEEKARKKTQKKAQQKKKKAAARGAGAGAAGSDADEAPEPLLAPPAAKAPVVPAPPAAATAAAKTEVSAPPLSKAARKAAAAAAAAAKSVPQPRASLPAAAPEAVSAAAAAACAALCEATDAQSADALGAAIADAEAVLRQHSAVPGAEAHLTPLVDVLHAARQARAALQAQPQRAPPPALPQQHLAAARAPAVAPAPRPAQLKQQKAAAVAAPPPPAPPQHAAPMPPPWHSQPPPPHAQMAWHPAPATAPAPLQPQPRWSAPLPPAQVAPLAPALGLPGLSFSPGVWGAVGSGAGLGVQPGASSGGGELAAAAARLGNGAFASATWGATGLPGLASPALWAALERGGGGVPVPSATPPPLCASPPPQVLELLAGDADFGAPQQQQAQQQRGLPALSIWHR